MTQNLTSNNQIPTLPVLAIHRHRLTTDGVGVSTLVGAHGCPLACKYCINPHAWDSKTLSKCTSMSPEDLYEKLKIDDLYFQATNGGICFGGGESLIHSTFIKSFRNVCGKKWRITVETSLNVANAFVEESLDAIDDYIIDVKDMNPIIYEAYTGKSNALVIENLAYLIAKKAPEHLHVRVPLIPNHNSLSDIEQSVSMLKEMGYQDIEVFKYVIK